MTETFVDIPKADPQWKLPSRGVVGMYGLIAAESAIFTIFLIAYIFYIGKSAAGPQPSDVLHVPIVPTICLLSSSLTIHFAVKLLRSGKVSSFAGLWSLTLALGGFFLAATFREWSHLIYADGLTIQTNLFGTTYYSLVGLHAFHVTVGLIGLAVVLTFAAFGKLTKEHGSRLEVLSMYWHFVDVVWVAVFTVVYVVGR